MTCRIPCGKRKEKNFIIFMWKIERSIDRKSQPVKYVSIHSDKQDSTIVNI